MKAASLPKPQSRRSSSGVCSNTTLSVQKSIKKSVHQTVHCCRAAASRLADRKDDASLVHVPATEVTQKPSLQKTSSSRRTAGDADHTSKAAHFLLKNPKASVSMLRRSPSDQKRVSGDVESGPTPTQGEIGASPFEYNQGRFSNKPILAGDESPTRNPLLRIPETFESLASASSGEMSTSSSRALLGHRQGSS